MSLLLVHLPACGSGESPVPPKGPTAVTPAATPAPSGAPGESTRAVPAAPTRPIRTLPSGRFDPTDFVLKSERIGRIDMSADERFLFASPGRDRVISMVFEKPAVKFNVIRDDGTFFTIDLPVQLDPNNSLDVRDGFPHQLTSHDAVKLNAWSADGSQFAFATWAATNNPIVIHGREVIGPLGKGKEVTSLVMSTDGKRLAFVVTERVSKTVSLFLDGKEIPMGSYPVFSPDSKRSFHVEQRAGDRFAVVDSKSYGPYPAIGSFAWSPDSKRFAFSSVDSERVTRTIVIDGTAGKSYPYIKPNSIQFSPDSRRVVFVAGPYDVGPYFVVDDGNDGERYPYLGGVWSLADGRILYNRGHAVKLNDDEPVHEVFVDLGTTRDYRLRYTRPSHVLDGNESPGFLSSVVTSARGELASVAYRRERGDSFQTVVLGDEKSSDFKIIRFLAFSPKGDHYSFVGSTSNTGGALASDSNFYIDGVAFPETLMDVLKELAIESHFTTIDSLEWESETSLIAAFSRHPGTKPKSFRRVRLSVVPRERKGN